MARLASPRIATFAPVAPNIDALLSRARRSFPFVARLGLRNDGPGFVAINERTRFGTDSESVPPPAVDIFEPISIVLCKNVPRNVHFSENCVAILEITFGTYFSFGMSKPRY